MSVAPQVSIVTPSFNQGEFIERAAESVLSQDYQAVEYLILDGGSTDGTLDVLRRLGGRVRWVSEPDRGQAHAINKGWQQAKGEVLAWLNADDLYLPGALSRVAAFFQTNPAVDIVYGDCDYIDLDDRVVQPYPTRPYDYIELVREAIDFIPQPAAFVRRRVLETTGLLDETLHYVLDYDYWLRAGLRHTVAYLPARLAAFRLHPASKTVGSEARFGRELVETYRRLFARADLPPQVRTVERQALANAHYMAAVRCFWGGDLALAREYGRQAWGTVTGYRARKLAALLGLTVLGRGGLAAARVVRARRATHFSGRTG
ncbi:MAG: glycosyltransferase family 2 protein [Armatimonadota bacterium]|nr:glycosyltransferase family 2 protein [Armatimonadota bacterium]MDR7496644.1 glycosyltransferase family 2 protein [Armatimonadota bacterium]